jgi:hypothetical protein
VVVLGVVHRLSGHRFAEVRIVGHAEHGNALQAFFLQGLEQRRADEDQPLDQGVARVALLRRLEGPVQVVQDVDELQEQPLAAVVETPLDVAGDPVTEPVVLGPDLAVGLQHLGQAVLRQARPGQELLGGARIGRGLEGGLERSLEDLGRGLRLAGLRLARLRLARLRVDRPVDGIVLAQPASRNRFNKEL